MINHQTHSLPLKLTELGCNLESKQSSNRTLSHEEEVFDELERDLEVLNTAVLTIQENLEQTITDKKSLIYWIVSKEEHANKFTRLLTEYFLQQHLDPEEEDVEKKLISILKMMRLIQELKESAEIAPIKMLKKELTLFQEIFMLQPIFN